MFYILALDYFCEDIRTIFMKRFFIVLAVMAVAFSACSSDNGNDDPFRTVEYTYIFNQGNYTEQNGEISVYEEDTHTTINRVFKQVNGYELASTIMDVTAIQTGLGYLLCANPARSGCNDRSWSIVTGCYQWN